MDPTYAFSANLFKWEPTRPNLAGPSSNRLLEMVATPLQPPQLQPPPLPATPPPTMTPTVSFGLRPPPPNCGRDQLGGLEELFQAYGVRYYTAAKIAELGFTVNTLLNMKDEELNDMMNSLCQIFRWELLVGERYGIKSAVRAERRRLEEEMEEARRRQHHHMFSAGGSGDGNISAHTAIDAFSQEGLSDEPVQQQQQQDQTKDVVGSGTAGSGEVGGTWEMVAAANQERNKYRRQRVHEQQRQIRNNNKKKDRYNNMQEEGNYEDEDDDDDYYMDQDDGPLLVGGGGGGGVVVGVERQREHPFIVTEPGEVARGKKNGLDYLFHLYELCREFLIQVQGIAKERGEKCPTKVTNQVFRYAKKAGATYINKPKMRHYVHCYALHCLDEETSNALRSAFKERRENVGAWRQACYKPLVAIAASQGWDIDAVFNAHPRLSIWYVPTKLRQLCHAERSSVAASAAASSSVSGGGGGGGGVDHLPF